ncbi:MAG: crotonobetainyl-CoA:carnitine CoA-transferase CaiB-like acyl-CoA transferase [Alcanivorax sp.]|jgi:crotonobetainyl-CoA:carnitine CoA-transferase CaiB-like acyl-CoA transferase
MSKPLAGVRMLDLTHMLSGPYGAMIIADLGADTIKVEPLYGEATRSLLANDPVNSLDGQGAYYITLNRNKRSVAIDLKSPEGLEVFYDLVRESDVVIENFSAGVADKLGIGYDDLAKVNPKIIACSVSGFGSNGPNFQRPAFDQVVQALGGGMSITGHDKSHQTRAGIPIGDLGGGMFGAMGIMAALYEREKSGVGQHVDISMLDCQISMLNYMATMHFLSGENPHPIGNGHFVHVPYNSFSTSDGEIIIAVIFDKFWHSLVEMLDFAPFSDSKFETQPGRLADKEFIEKNLIRILSTNTSDYWLQRLEAKRIPCARVNNFAEALNDEQVLARNMVIDLEHPNGKKTKGPGNPIKLSRTAEESFSPAPLLGEHTHGVLTELLGYSDSQVEALRAAGSIA